MLSDLLSGIFPDVTLGQFTSLRGLIVEVAGGLVPDIKNLLVEGTKTYSLIMSVLEFVLRFVLILVGTIVVYVLCIVIRLLSFVIGSIIRLFTIRRRRRKRKEREAKRQNRCIGSAEASYSYLYPKIGYDITVDTNSLLISESVFKILKKL